MLNSTAQALQEVIFEHFAIRSRATARRTVVSNRASSNHGPPCGGAAPSESPNSHFFLL
jgi:hypothetical protein